MSFHWLGPTPARRVLAVVLIAFAVRGVCVLGQPLIGADSSRFLAAAELIEDGEQHRAVREDYHPLPAFLFATANRVQGWFLSESDPTRDPNAFRADQSRRERAAYLLTILAGTLSVWLLIDLSRRWFTTVPPELVGLFAAFHPYLVRTSADIMSDGLFIALLLLALRQGDEAIARRRWGAAVSCGGAVGLAYLCRPEALVLGPALVAFAAIRLWPRRSPRVGLEWLGGSALVALTAALLVVPYMATLFFDSGEWMLTRKKSLSALLGLAQLAVDSSQQVAAGVSDALIDGRALVRIVDRWFFASSEVFGVATVCGIIGVVRRREWSPGHTLFAMVVAMIVALLMLLLHSSGDYGYVTKRHVITLAALGVPFAARGVEEFCSWWRPLLSGRVASGFPVFVVAALLVTTGVKALAPQRYDQIAQREAAEFILHHGGSAQIVFTPREKVAYYCGSQRQLWPMSPPALIAAVRDHSEVWVTFYREKRPGYTEALGLEIDKKAGWSHAATFVEEHRDPPRHLELYRWVAP